MEPTQKSEEIETFLQNVFGINRQEKIRNNQCVLCEKFIEFSGKEDPLTLREFSISGLCPDCQEGTFIHPKDDSYP